MKRVYTILLLLVAFSLVAMAQEKQMSIAERNAAQGYNDTIDRLAPDFVLVSFCVADPTTIKQDYSGLTGHAFLRLQCRAYGLDYCFSYENEKIKGQEIRYLLGKLKMRMVAVPTDEYLEDYRAWQRAVHEYYINIPSEAKLRLWEQMDNHMMSERDMQMDLIKFGCTNTILRYVEKAIYPASISYHWPEKFLTKSAMEIVEDHYDAYPWCLFVLRITSKESFAELQTPKQKVIFPTDLLEVWSQSTLNGEPMLEYVGDLVEAEPVIVKKPWFTPQVCGILLLMIVIGGIVWAIIRKRKS